MVTGPRWRSPQIQDEAHQIQDNARQIRDEIRQGSMTPARVILGLWLLGLIAGCAIIMRTTFSTDMSAFLPRSPRPEQRILVDQLREGVVSRLVLLAIEGAPPEIMAALSKAMAGDLRNDPAFGIVSNGDEAAFAADRDLLWRNRYLLSPAVTPGHFSPPELHAALEADARLLGSDAGILVKQSLPADPTGEMRRLIEALGGQARPETREGVWFSRDGARVLLLVRIMAAGFDIDGQERALRRIDAAFATAQTSLSSENRSAAAHARLIETGSPVFSVRTRDRMKQDVQRLSLIATLMVTAVLLVAYRSVRVLVLALLPVLTGAIAGIAGVGLVFGFVHGITLGFGVTLIGEAVDYAIYLFTQTEPGTPASHTLPRIWPTLRLGMLTSVCGFSAMLLSSFIGFAQLGLFTITGLLVALAVTRWVLPALLPIGFASAGSTIFAAPLVPLMQPGGALRFSGFRSPGSRSSGPPSSGPRPSGPRSFGTRSFGLRSFGLRSLRLRFSSIRFHKPHSSRLQLTGPTLLVCGLSLAAGISLVLHRGPWWDSDLASMSPLSAAEKSLNEQLRGEIGAPDIRHMVVVRASDREHALIETERVAAQLEWLVADGIIAGFEAPSAWLPSLASQRARQSVLPGEPTLRANLAQAIEGTPFRPDTFAPFEEDIAAARNQTLLRREDMEGGSLAARVDSLMVADAGKWLAMLPLRGVSNAGAVAKFVGGFNDDDFIFLDLKAESDRLLGAYLREALTLSVVGSLAIVVLLSVSLRSPRRTAAVLLPLAAAVVCTAAILLTSSGRLSIFNLFGLLLVAAVGSNYCLFFERTIPDASGVRMIASLVLADLCTVIGFGILSFSSFPVLHGIGLTVAIGACLSLLFGAMLSRRPPHPWGSAARDQDQVGCLGRGVSGVVGGAPGVEDHKVDPGRGGRLDFTPEEP